MAVALRLVLALAVSLRAGAMNFTVSGRLLAGGAGSTCGTAGTAADFLGEPVDVATGAAGEVFILDRTCSRVTQVPIAGGTTGGGTVVAAGSQGSFANALHFPSALAFDSSSGHLYIADWQNHRIMRWTPGGASGTSVVDGGPSTSYGKLYGPSGVALADGVLHVVESVNQRFQAFQLSSCCSLPASAIGSVTMGCEPLDLPCFSGGYAVTALQGPTHVAAGDGALFVADTGNHRVIRVFLNGTSSSDPQVFAGTTGIPGCRPEQLNSPSGLAFSDGFLYVADTGNHRVQKFAPGALPVALTVAGDCCCSLGFDGLGEPLGGAELHQLNGPRGLAVDSSGALVVADTGNHRVLAFGGTGYEQLSSPASSCAYGVACTVRLFGAVTMAARNSQIVVVGRDEAGVSPCGSKNCTFAHWPGMKNPQMAGGDFLDSYELGMPHGPPNTSVSGIGEYALCWAESPSTACVGYQCSEDDSCSNASAWLCNGAQPLGLVRKLWRNLPGKTLADLRGATGFPDHPDLEEFASSLASSDQGDNYGQMFYGLFLAPETGTYTFQITSDENSELRISSEFNDTVGQVVAYISEAQTWYEGPFLRQGYAPSSSSWDTFPSQSGSFYMEAGHLYYLEVLHKENVQSDFLLAGVTLPSGTIHRPIPSSFFDPKTCTQGFPSGLAVVHDCLGVKTGQSCTARCQGGYSGSEQTFVCDGLGVFHGRDPLCTAVQCEEYDLEVGSLFMHGIWDEVDCSNMAGHQCIDLRSWAGPETCAFRALTAGTCSAFCGARGRSCVKSSPEVDACLALKPGQVTTSVVDGSCEDALPEQICVCGRVELSSSSTCLLSAWCSQGLMSPGGYPLGATADEKDDLIIVDSMRAVVVRWVGHSFRVLAGGNGPGNALNQLNGPLGAQYVSGSPGSLYIADTLNHRIMQWQDGASVGSLLFGTGSPGAGLSELRFPAGIHFNQSLYVVDYGNSRVLRVDSGTSVQLSEQEVLSLPIIPTTAADSFFDGQGNFFRVDYGNHRLTVCFRLQQCVLTGCRDADATAEYGASCGCFEDRATCREAMGVLE